MEPEVILNMIDTPSLSPQTLISVIWPLEISIRKLTSSRSYSYFWTFLG